MEAPFTSDGLVTWGGTDYTWRTTNSQYQTVNGISTVTGSSTYERDMYMWTGPVLVKDPSPVNETSTCEWNEMSTCEWIFDKRLKIHRWFLHVLTRHKENYTCRLKLNLFFFFFFFAIVRLSAVRLTVIAFSFWQDYIEWDFCEALPSIILHKSWYLSKCKHQRPSLILSFHACWQFVKIG